jgi:hypothetical protein
VDVDLGWPFCASLPANRTQLHEQCLLSFAELVVISARVANSLQIIASILLLKSGSVSSEETKNELRAAHQRVMSVATVQSHLNSSDGIEQIEMGPYGSPSRAPRCGETEPHTQDH